MDAVVEHARDQVADLAVADDPVREVELVDRGEVRERRGGLGRAGHARGLGLGRRQHVVGVVEPDVAGVARLGVLGRAAPARRRGRVERDVVDPAVGRDHEVRRDVVGQRLHDDERDAARGPGLRLLDGEPLGVARDDAEHDLARFELDDRGPERGRGQDRLAVAVGEHHHRRLAQDARAAGPLVGADELAQRLLHLGRRHDDGPRREPVADRLPVGSGQGDGGRAAGRERDRLGASRLCGLGRDRDAGQDLGDDGLFGGRSFRGRLGGRARRQDGQHGEESEGVGHRFGGGEPEVMDSAVRRDRSATTALYASPKARPAWTAPSRPSRSRGPERASAT